MLKEELFKKVIECKNTLVSIENKMSKTEDQETKEKLENEWTEVFGMEQSYITAIENIYKQEKYESMNKEEKTNDEFIVETNQNEEKVEVELPEIEKPIVEEEKQEKEEETPNIELPQVEEIIPETPVEETKEEEVNALVTPLNEINNQVNDENTKSVFINEKTNPDVVSRPISVTSIQGERLYNSLGEQSKLLEEFINNNNKEQAVVTEIPKEDFSNEIDPEKELENMVNQQRELLAEGKKEEAEAMTEEIMTYSKKMSSGIAA